MQFTLYDGPDKRFIGKYEGLSDGYWRYLSVQDANLRFREGYCFYGKGYADEIGRHVKSVANLATQDVCVADGYDTVANGWAENIWCPAGKGIIRVNGGSPYDFAKWRVVSIEEATKRGAKRIVCIDEEKIIIE